MLLELVLAALVLTMVGVALYQSNHHKPNDVGASLKPAVATATNVAEVTAREVQKSAETDTALSETAESSADQFGAVDDDVANLEASFNENNF